ncbi:MULTISPECIES: DUF6320 domain-containing protein [Butyrivibrio]|jgi:hypothetical protein|uniref:Zinc ribbon domain-containing protein n=1 Tax=Butyrivibrio fibrisolvens TaxID=831 RepID=A0A317G5K0_BUTFI|nr:MULTISPECIES: DUF6320 domain-containing protein [Butyrivibrio]PWT27750.1 hypothetical protein CPT75_11905 [Butyrivibrio fibrisolvens]SEP62901.1 hypothetical protein SAMN02910382_00508 [Butyrivibrio sp. TB]
MQYCPKCKVKVRGYKTECPLCQGRLTGTPEAPAYPVLKKRVSRVSLLKILTFILAVVVIIMLSARFILVHQIGNTDSSWPGVVITASFVVWVDMVVAIMLRGNILKLVTFEAYAVMLISYCTDRVFGNRGWDIAWTIPMTLIALLCFTILIGIVTRAHLEDYVNYLIFDFVVAMIQLIPIIRETNIFMWPAVICVALYLILAAAIILFRFRDLKNASAKFWNM